MSLFKGPHQWFSMIYFIYYNSQRLKVSANDSAVCLWLSFFSCFIPGIWFSFISLQYSDISNQLRRFNVIKSKVHWMQTCTDAFCRIIVTFTLYFAHLVFKFILLSWNVLTLKPYSDHLEIVFFYKLSGNNLWLVNWNFPKHHHHQTTASGLNQ